MIWILTVSDSLAGEAQDAVNFTKCAQKATHIPEDADRVGTILCCASVPALSLFLQLLGSVSSSCSQDLERGGCSLGHN